MNVIGFKEAKCKNCYKCVRNCDVKAITVKDAQAYIMNDKCILCGHCLEVCPQNAKTLISDLERVKEYIKEGHQTIISLAPAYLGVLKYNTPGQVISALLKLGFTAVRETAEGAAYVTREYDKLIAAGEMENIITTCCPSLNDLVEIYYPSLTKYLAPVISPMIAHGKIIREEYGPNVKVVFLGPCISKKREAESDPRTVGIIDAVINFKELEEWLLEEGIDILEQPDTPPSNPNPLVNRLYQQWCPFFCRSLQKYV
jgi:iron only hydrogenase large subunit-like protein